MKHDDDYDDDEEPRPLPKVVLLSELKGQLQTAASLARGKARPNRSASRSNADDAADAPSARRPAPAAPPSWGRGSPAKTSPAPIRSPMDDEDGPFLRRPAPAAPPSSGRGSPAKGAPASGGRGRRAPKPPTAERFWASALYHISQRETSSADLRRLLLNKVRRYALTLDGTARAEAEATGAEHVETTVARALKERMIDDARYSEMKVRSWRNRGWGERRIAMEMRRKGLGDDLAQDALREVDGEALDGIDDPDVSQKEADRLAAETLCRRKRMGPFRKEQPRDAHERAKIMRREMGALARAGFGGDVIRDLLGRPPEDGDEDY